MQALYAHYQDDDSTIQKSEKELFYSISKSLDQYYLYILLLLELKNFAQEKIEIGKNKNVPTPEELNPNTKFVDNKVLAIFDESELVTKYVSQNGNAWTNYPEIARGLYQDMIASDLYVNYMASEEEDVESEKKFIGKLLEKVIAYHEPLFPAFEEQSIYWNDEVEFVLSMIIKTVKGITTNGELTLLGEFKDDEDRDYVKRLFRKAALNQKEHLELIKKFSKNWDSERVAVLDIILINEALAEIIEFTAIPVKVSMNEYIEIAKHYSTEKSSVFINGILDKAVNHLTEEKVIRKAGRGLVEGKKDV